MQQARLVKREESRDVGALMLLLLLVPTRIVAMIAQVVFPPSICIAITGTTYVGRYAWKSQMQAAAWPAQSREPFTKRVTTFPRNASKPSLHVHHLL